MRLSSSSLENTSFRAVFVLNMIFPFENCGYFYVKVWTNVETR